MCQDMRGMLVDGQFMDAIICFLTGGGDPLLEVLVPTAVYGSILLSMFIFGSSVLMPVIVSIILGGVIVAVFPATATTIVILAVMGTLAAAGQALVWRMGR